MVFLLTGDVLWLGMVVVSDGYVVMVSVFSDGCGEGEVQDVTSNCRNNLYFSLSAVRSLAGPPKIVDKRDRKETAGLFGKFQVCMTENVVNRVGYDRG
ncbi:hypothetical protein Tco_1499909 [Tanacetum coccineum]